MFEVGSVHREDPGDDQSVLCFPFCKRLEQRLLPPLWKCVIVILQDSTVQILFLQAPG